MASVELVRQSVNVRRLLAPLCRERRWVRLESQREELGALLWWRARARMSDLEAEGRNPYVDLLLEHPREEDDPLPPQPGDQVLVQFASPDYGAFCQFMSEVLSWAEGGRVLRVRFPGFVERMQRRSTLRVHIPPEEPLYATLETAEGTALRVPLQSLSAHGAGFLLPEDAPLRAGTTLRRFRIEFAEGPLEREARVNEIAERPDGRRYVSLVFLDRRGEHEERIRHYMKDLLERRAFLGPPSS